MAKPNVGLIGAGLMGHGVALNICKSEYALCFLDHPGNQPCQDIVALGATPMSAIGDVVANSDVVLVCVTGSPQVREVVLGVPGVAGELTPGQVVIDLSTIEPATGRAVREAIVEAGGQYLDAPMTRTPKEARQGRLNLLVGGDAELLERSRPLLQTFSETITHAGPAGAGHALKLLHNFVSLGNCALLAEAVVCARAAGVDDGTFLEVLAGGGGGSTALDRLAPYIREADVAGFLFSIGNCAKDLGYYNALADDLDAPGGVARAILKTYAGAAEDNDSTLPVPRLIDILQVTRGPKDTT